MSTALVRRTDEFSLDIIRDMGDIFVKSGYFKDARDQAQAIVKILYGRELGFSPVISMSGIHVIEGKPALSSNLMGAMVKRSGKYNYRVKSLTDKECVLEFTEDGKPAGDSSFTMEDAQKARVIRDGSGWTKYPRNMLFARALSNGVKLFCPELSACPIYVPEELGAEVNEEGAVTSVPATVIEPKRSTEVRTFGKPKDSESVGETLVKEPPSTTADSGIVADSDTVEQLEQSIAYISAGQAANLHKQFRKAVEQYHPEKALESDDKLYGWLKHRGYGKKDADGKIAIGSAGCIPASGWFRVRDEALEYAKALTPLP